MSLFTPRTKFENSSSFSPGSSELRSSSSGFIGMLVYPEDIGKYYIKLSFLTYVRPTAKSAATYIPTITVVLPIPQTLNDNFNVSYNDVELGAVTGTLMDAAMKGASQAGGNVLSQVSGAATSLAKQSGNIVELGYAGLRQRITNETLKAVLDKATGVVPNPHLSAIFQNVSLREHNFAFRFSPRSEKESTKLKNLIDQIKFRILPGIEGGDGDTGPLFVFPDVIDISFGPKELYPYFFERCVCTNFSANYAPNGTPAFLKDGNSTDIELTMAFKEIKVVSRETIKKKNEAAFINAGGF